MRENVTAPPKNQRTPAVGTIGNIQGPNEGEVLNPLGRLANAQDLEGISSGVNDIRWGAAQVARGIIDGTHHKNSIIGMAQANVFEFPVFISESVPLEYATATNTLLEQVYAAYLQMAISINPVVDYKQIKERQDVSQFAKFKTNTTKYIECVDLSFQKDACHNVIFNDDDNTLFEFDMCSITDSDARIVLEALDYQPLSEFDHYFMESDNQTDDSFLFDTRISNKNGMGQILIPVLDQNGKLVRKNSKIQTHWVDFEVPDTTTGKLQINPEIEEARKALFNNQQQGVITVDINGTTKTFTRDEFRKMKESTSVEKLKAEIKNLEASASKSATDKAAKEADEAAKDKNRPISGRSDGAESTSRDANEQLTVDRAEELRRKLEADGKKPEDIVNDLESADGPTLDKLLDYYKAEGEKRGSDAAKEDVIDLIDKVRTGKKVSTEEAERVITHLRAKESTQADKAGKKSYEKIVDKLEKGKTLTPAEIQRLSDIARAKGDVRSNKSDSDNILNVLDRLGTKKGTAEDERRIVNFFRALSAETESDTTRQQNTKITRENNANIELIENIMKRGIKNANKDELEKVITYCTALKANQERIENDNVLAGIIGKFGRFKKGEEFNLSPTEVKRLDDLFRLTLDDLRTSEAETHAKKIPVQSKVVDAMDAPDAKYHVGSEELNTAEIDQRMKGAQLEKITKELTDAKNAELYIKAWLNQDDSAEGGMSVKEKHSKYGSDMNEITAQNILDDRELKSGEVRQLREKLKAYDNFTAKYGKTPDEYELDLKVEKEAREKRKERFEMKASKAPQFIDETKIKKMNTMKPLMMTVTMSIMAQDGHVSHPMEYVVGVKTHCRIIKSSMLPEVIEYPIREMNKVSRKAKWRAGELKFFKDILFHIKEKKQTAIDSKDPNRKWYRRLYELAHMKGDGNVSKKISGMASTHGLIPNATVIISKSDVDNIEEVTKIDMLKASNARNFCEELFLMGFIVIDVDSESIKILTPDINNEFEVQSLAAVNKQIAELDTAGKSTRDIFKMLK